MKNRTSTQYRDLLKSLLPKGKIWNLNNDSFLVMLLNGIGEEFSRIDERGYDLFDEKDTRTTEELLTEHEEDFNLPDEGDSISNFTEVRRDELQAMLLKVGNQNKEYFEEIADALGYDIQVDQFQPFWAGFSTAGSECGDQENLFFWKIQIKIESVTESFEVNLMKLINKISKNKPGHTIVLFDFYGIEYGRGFDRAFSRCPHYDNSFIEQDFSRDFSVEFANAYDYDGINYVGSFNYDFSISFDRHSGGSFFRDDFGSGFTRPS